MISGFYLLMVGLGLLEVVVSAIVLGVFLSITLKVMGWLLK